MLEHLKIIPIIISNYLLKNINEGLDILNQMVFHSLIDKKELDKERHVVIEEINKGIDDSEDYLDDLVGEKIFNGNNLGHKILGDKKNILGYKKQDLINFIKKYYIVKLLFKFIR